MIARGLILLLLAAVASLSMGACREDVVAGENRSMMAVIDGEEWEARSVEAEVGGGTLTISGVAEDASGIILTIPNNVEPGEYTLGSSSEYTAGYLPTSSDILDATTGSVTITANTALQVSGTFTFEATDGMTTALVTSGSFVAERQ